MSERLKLDGAATSSVTLIFGIALLTVGVIVISNLDDLGDSFEGSR